MAGYNRRNFRLPHGSELTRLGTLLAVNRRAMLSLLVTTSHESMEHNASDDFRRQLLARLATGNRVPSKRQARNSRRLFRDLTRKRQPGSMLNRGQPKGHRPPVADERTKVLFAAHHKRQDAGWIRG